MKELTPKQRRKIKALNRTVYVLWSELEMYNTICGEVDFSKVRVLIKRLNKHYDDFKKRDKK